jgi:hypothetical protein
MSLFSFLGLPLFSSDVFLAEPLYVFLGCLFFYQMSILMSPFLFFGLPLFSSEVFFDEPLCIF